MEAVNAVQASVIQEIKERRVTIVSFAAGLGGAGFGVAGGAGDAAFVDSSLLIGISSSRGLKPALFGLNDE
jgi:hypothetical protein